MLHPCGQNRTRTAPDNQISQGQISQAQTAKSEHRAEWAELGQNERNAKEDENESLQSARHDRDTPRPGINPGQTGAHTRGGTDLLQYEVDASIKVCVMPFAPRQEVEVLGSLTNNRNDELEWMSMALDDWEKVR